MLNPITYCIAREKICQINPTKTKLLSNLIPGNILTYNYHTEEAYYQEYQKSYFAITMKKGGWDCMRHYEIIVNKSLPYFLDIEDCPETTMTHYPKNYQIEANALYHKLKHKKINEFTEEDINEYNQLRDRFMEHLQQHLTTDKMAEYILNSTNYRNVKKILFLSGNIIPDYSRCTILHGFKLLYGRDFHDYPKIPHVYKSDLGYTHLYGRGFSYTNLLEHELHDDTLDTTIVENIRNKYYDIVIYGFYHRGMPFYDLVQTVYEPNEIILLCGEDFHDCDCEIYLQKGHYVFVREL
jgi:hypothetical protein